MTTKAFIQSARCLKRHPEKRNAWQPHELHINQVIRTGVRVSAIHRALCVHPGIDQTVEGLAYFVRQTQKGNDSI